MKIFYCDKCRQIIYFENTECLACDSHLGFLQDFGIMSSVKAQANGLWKALARTAKGKLYKKCGNFEEQNVCNWMIPADDQSKYCFSCRLNKTIPNLDDRKNRFYWYRLEVAKRRLLYCLFKLSLPLVGRETDPEYGLAFEFLEDEKSNFQETKQIMTGHANGIITINIAEADDALRVKMRTQMKERYRTILGHFRHEIGHYYWTLLIEKAGRLEEFRVVFGDERTDYAKALTDYYASGPQSDWQSHYVTAYASSHPWEDWAETWAHYLHMVDTLDTAKSWGMSLSPWNENDGAPAQQAQQKFFDQNDWNNFDGMYRSWAWMTCAINSMNRSMGLNDFYPFALSSAAVDKIRFIDGVIKSAGHHR